MKITDIELTTEQAQALHWKIKGWTQDYLRWCDKTDREAAEAKQDEERYGAVVQAATERAELHGPLAYVDPHHQAEVAWGSWCVNGDYEDIDEHFFPVLAEWHETWVDHYAERIVSLRRAQSK